MPETADLVVLVADPAGFAGEIWDKPGMLRFEPGEPRTFSMQVTLAA